MELAPFIPHPYSALAGVFSPGSMPEAAYLQAVGKYEAAGDIITRRITYTSDGLRVTGLMVTPARLTEAGHPLLIYNRGGNREYGKLTAHQVMRSFAPFARVGYLVFGSNYRGNDGGEGREEFGGADVHDVLALLVLAKEHSAWDGRNVYMLGHSRGGMMTYLAMKQGAALNAAVSIAGMSDMFACVAERPDMSDIFTRLIVGDAAQREALYRERSAVLWPQQITAPLLLLHGDADNRVSVSHSIRLAAALAASDKPHELVVYEGGNHALLRHWDRALEACLSWFARYRQ